MLIISFKIPLKLIDATNRHCVADMRLPVYVKY